MSAELVRHEYRALARDLIIKSASRNFCTASTTWFGAIRAHIMFGIHRCLLHVRILLRQPLDDRRRVPGRPSAAYEQSRRPNHGQLLPHFADGPPRRVSAASPTRHCVGVVGIAFEHIAAIYLRESLQRAVAVQSKARGSSSFANCAIAASTVAKTGRGLPVDVGAALSRFIWVSTSISLDSCSG